MSRWTIERLDEVALRASRRASAEGPPAEAEPPAASSGKTVSIAASLADSVESMRRLRDSRIRTTVPGRRGWPGLVVRAIKKAYRVFGRSFIGETLETQVFFNRATTDAVEAVQEELRAAERTHEELRRQLADSRRELEEDRAAAVARQRAEVRELASLLVEKLREMPPGVSPAAAATAEADFEYAELHRETSDPEVTRANFAPYVSAFRGAERVLDAGCGRGPFLDLLREAGIPAYGVDANPHLVAEARALGHEVVLADIQVHLDGLAPASLGGIFSAHLVEHLPTPALLRFLRACHRALRPGGRLVLETPNTESPLVLTSSFFRDPTHQLPRHPAQYESHVRQCGFVDIEIAKGHPPDERWVFRRLPEGAEVAPECRETLDWNAGRLNEILWQPANVSLSARRPEEGS